MIANDTNTHSSGDPFLTILSTASGTLGTLVRAFPGIAHVASSPSWLEDWFTESIASQSGNEEDGTESNELSEALNQQFKQRPQTLGRLLKITSLQPYYFRGFRRTESGVDFRGDLVVLDGRNSSGKTSLAEALEWLFTGQLQRRVMQEQGNPRELEGCVSNQLRPQDEKTWVEAQFEEKDSTKLTLRRVLVTDYGSTSTSRCNSQLFVNNKELSKDEEKSFLEDTFGSLPPLLMQHTLRLFVHSSPAERRNYFERLLRLDELTYLIEKAVIGNTRLKDFPSPTGSAHLPRWTRLKDFVKASEAKAAIRRAESSPSRGTFENALRVIAITEFKGIVEAQSTLEQAEASLKIEQQKTRQAQFPLLVALKPKRTLDENTRAALDSSPLNSAYQCIVDSRVSIEIANTALKKVNDADRAMSDAFRQLVMARLIDPTRDYQECPLCQTAGSLTIERCEMLSRIQPFGEALTKARTNYSDALRTYQGILKSVRQTITALLPTCPPDKEWEVAQKQASEGVIAEAQRTKIEFDEVSNSLAPTISAYRNMEALLSGDANLTGFDSQLENGHKTFVSLLPNTIKLAERIITAYQSLERAVGTQASDSGEYSRRNDWLTLTTSIDELVSDFAWELAKRKVQKSLEKARANLLVARQTVLESRRHSFNERMTRIWQILRQDRFSVFKDLHIPEPRTKGFPVEIEVRATLDDGKQQIDVDALRIFSESQVNVLGIAAFITRSELVGHSFLIFDDPVQSMDEEHFKTLSEKLLASLLEANFQVIILTHNDTFARDISYAHSDREGYVTLSIQHSRRNGCEVREGNRRVQERLDRAEKLAENGDLSDAWITLRRALERLYILAYQKHCGKTFEPRTWSSHTAEGMWEEGVGDILMRFVPGCGDPLKDILNCTAAGAHDKAPRGATDIANACRYVRGLLTPLRIGG